jgi:integrase
MSVWINAPGEEGHTKRGNSHEVHVQDTRRGVNIFKRFKDRAAAEKFSNAAKVLLDLDAVEQLVALARAKQFGGPVQQPIPTLGDWMEQRFAIWGPPDGRCRQSTIDTYRRLLSHLDHLIHIPLDRITRRMIMEVLGSLRRIFSWPTFQNIAMLLRVGLESAADHGLIQANPMPSATTLRKDLGGKKKKKGSAGSADEMPNAYTAKEFERLVDAAEHPYYTSAHDAKAGKDKHITLVNTFEMTPEKGLRDKAFVLLGGDGGLRESEVAGLKIADVDFEKNQLKVERQFNEYGEGSTKGDCTRYVDLPVLLAETLRKWIETMTAKYGKMPGGWLFPSRVSKRKGIPITRSGIINAWKRIVRRAGVRYLSYHKLRHTCASALRAENVPTEAVADQLGQRDKTVTENTYQHPFPEARRNAVYLDDRRARARQALQQETP